MIETIETNVSKQLLIVSTGDFTNRGKIFEFYGSNFDMIWRNFLTAYHVNKLDQTTYLRIDIAIEEEKTNYEQFIQRLKKIRRNNYIDFNVRIDGLRKKKFFKRRTGSKCDHQT